MNAEITRSIGCELQPNLIRALPEFKSTGLVSHLQITVPNTLTYFQASEAAGDLPVIAHCNLLNTFGENTWSELQPWSKQIRSLRPVHVVEHFTQFRSRSGTKTGIAFDTDFTKGTQRQRIVDAIKTWQDMLGVQLCLENVPLSHNVDAYFDFLLDVKVQTGCGIACDLPHFFLSMFSARKTDAQILDLAHDLDPLQLHVGGLSLSAEGVIRDNHKLFSPWILSQGGVLFPNATYITLEQNHQVPSAAVAAQLKEMLDPEKTSAPDSFRAAIGMNAGAANLELTRDTARANHYPEPTLSAESDRRSSARHGCDLKSSLDLYDKYLPFLSPVSALEEKLNGLDASEVVRALAAMSQWSFSYLSWWNPEQARNATAAIRYGEGETTRFERRIGATPAALKIPEMEETYRFSSEGGFWVEVTSPKLHRYKRDLNEMMEVRHDAGAI